MTLTIEKEKEILQANASKFEDNFSDCSACLKLKVNHKIALIIFKKI